MSGRIVLIDNDDARRQRLKALFEAGYLSVIGVDTVAHALEDSSDRMADLALVALVIGPEGLSALPTALTAMRNATRWGAPPVLLLLGNEARRQEGAGVCAAAFSAGVQDVLETPRDDGLLLSRVRHQIRLRGMSDELARRRHTARDLGLEFESEENLAGPATVLMIAPRTDGARRLKQAVEQSGSRRCIHAETGFAALRVIESSPPDAVLIVDPGDFLDLVGSNGFREAGEDPLDLIAALAARGEMRRVPILFAGIRRPGAWSAHRINDALDAGASDYAPLEEEPGELLMRLDAQLRRKRYSDRLMASLDEELRLVVRDPLTGLHNRRYFDLHAPRLMAEAQRSGRPLSALLFDLDRFKEVNDTYGHAAGDRALAVFAERLRDEVRSADLLCRWGGEEFLVLMPNAALDDACSAADRVRAALRVTVPGVEAEDAETTLPSVSVGVACLRTTDEQAADLVARADAALLDAKRAGRDRVFVAA